MLALTNAARPATDTLRRYALEKIQYGIDRYINETRRLYGVLDKHLKDSNTGFLVGSRCTIADISHIGWVLWAGWAGVNIDEFPELKKWSERMLAIPEVAKGNEVPVPSKILSILKDPKETEEYAKHHSRWIMKGQEEDAKK